MAIFHPRCGAQLTVAFDGRGAPNKIFTIDHVKPRSCTVARNGYHEADTWHATFDARVLPLDPESIASMAIRIYMWDSGGDENKEWQVDENEMIRGLADDDEFKIGSDQQLVVSGRDYTAALDAEWDSRVSIPAGITLDDAVQFVADKAAPVGSAFRFNVVWEAETDPVRSAGAARSSKRKGMWIKPGKTHWDVIYDLCIQHGFIVFIRKSTIHISDPRTQTQESIAQAPVFTHGRDLISFSAKRKLAKERVPQIKIVYWDAKQRAKFEVLHPKRGAKLTTGLGLKKNEIETIPAPAYCHDKDSALRFAKMRWELLARSETTYKIETRHVTVPGPSPISIVPETGESFTREEDFNLLRLREGDAVRVEFDPFLGDQMRALDYAGRVRFLESLGYAPRLCAFVATNIDRIDQFRQPYYVKRAEFDFEQRDGLKIEIDAVNFAYERREIAFADSFEPLNTIVEPDAVSGAA